MRNATRAIAAATAFLLAACRQGQQADEQNIVIDSGNIPANADIEALPPDESSATPTDELVNHADGPEANEAVNNS